MTTSTTARLAAAQTARAAAKRAFSRATDEAVHAALARGLHVIGAINAFVEADPGVIAARAASLAAITELEAAEAAMRADATVLQDERMEASTSAATVKARAMVEHDPARIYDAAAGCES